MPDILRIGRLGGITVLLYVLSVVVVGARPAGAGHGSSLPGKTNSLPLSVAGEENRAVEAAKGQLRDLQPILNVLKRETGKPGTRMLDVEMTVVDTAGADVALHLNRPQVMASENVENLDTKSCSLALKRPVTNGAQLSLSVRGGDCKEVSRIFGALLNVMPGAEPPKR